MAYIFYSEISVVIQWKIVNHLVTKPKQIFVPSIICDFSMVYIFVTIFK